MVNVNISEKETEQVAYIISYAMDTRIGCMCIYKDKVLIADDPKELYELLQLVWEVTK